MTSPITSQQPEMPSTSAHSLLAFALGLYFSLLQFSYFFLLEAYVSSRSVSFFFALFFWLCGFLGGLWIQRPAIMKKLIAISIVAYYIAWFAVKQSPYHDSNYAIVGIAISFSGLAPGYYFYWARHHFPKIKKLFFHENNGFIAGIVLSLFSALFAGAWLLNWGALSALFPVILIANRINKGKTTPGTQLKPGANPFLPYIQGFHFGILQVSLYLTIQVFYSASYVGYFLVVLAWMGGVFIGLRWLKTWQLRQAGYLSLAAYIVLLLSLSLLAPYDLLIPFIALLSSCIAIPVGILFRQWENKIPTGTLFLHENNGFILGYLVSMLGFIQWGIHFLYWGPLLSFATTQLSGPGKRKGGLALLSAAVIAAWFSGGNAVAISLLAVFTLAVLLLFLKPNPILPARTGQQTLAWGHFTPGETKQLLLISGLCLILLQYLITREFSAILSASELAILVVAAAYLTGLSVGYGLFRQLPMKWLQPFAVVLFFLHLIMLPLIKPFAGILISLGWGWEVLLGLLFITAFFTSAFYSILLPGLIEARGAKSLVSAYSWDLLGAATGVLFMLGLINLWPMAIWPAYFLGMAIIVKILLKETAYERSFAVIAAITVGVFSYYQSDIFTTTTEDYYRSRNYDHPKLLYSGNSLYHSIDIIQSYRDEAQTQRLSRTSFLNGVRYFQQKYSDNQPASHETGLGEFTYFLAELPAKIQYQKHHKKLRILILGAGSMSSLKRVRPYSAKTTLVELDPLVVKSSTQYWSDLNGGDLKHQNEEIIIDDAKHYLMTSNERFDLIIMDISAPYYLGTLLLHNREFFRLVRSRLKPRGMFAESTQSRPKPKAYGSTAMRILRAADEVFPYWNLVDTHGKSRGKHGYIYAYRKNLTSTKKLIKQLESDHYRSGSSVYTHNSSRFKLQRVTPYTLSNLDSLLTANSRRISRRLKLQQQDKDQNSLSQWIKHNGQHYALVMLAQTQFRSPAFWGFLFLLLALGFTLRRKIITAT